MNDRWVLELVGYVASALVAVSLMMSSILRLRVINLVGSATFAVYGLLIGAYPVAAVNAFIVLINLWFLRGMLRSKEYFRLLEVRSDSEYLRFFLDHYAGEIGRYLPGFSHRAGEGQLTLFVLRDLIPAGLILGDVREGTLHVRLDFVIPQYRDFKIGRFVFHDQAEWFRARGIREVVSDAGSREHQDYLRRMGFAPAGAGEYRLAVA